MLAPLVFDRPLSEFALGPEQLGVGCGSSGGERWEPVPGFHHILEKALYRKLSHGNPPQAASRPSRSARGVLCPTVNFLRITFGSVKNPSSLTLKVWEAICSLAK